MPMFSFTVLLGAEETKTKSVYAELMIFIVRSETRKTYAACLADAEEFWNEGGPTVSLVDNKNLHDPNLSCESFEAIQLKSYIADLGEVEQLSNIGDIKHYNCDLGEDSWAEFFSKTFRFENVEAYHEFASASEGKNLYSVGMYSNPDRYFMREEK